MKKIFGLVTLFICMFALAIPAEMNAQLSQSQEKAIAKDVKKRAKELKKAGWEPLASTATMEYALTKYRVYLEQDPENRVAITGIAVGNNPKIGRDNATHAGVANYAARAKAQIVGKMKSVTATEGHNVSAQEIDKFGEAYEQAVSGKVQGLIKEHFCLVRIPKNGGAKEFNVFMSLDENQARKAREEAARVAREQAQLDQIGTMVEDFIGEPVEADE